MGSSNATLERRPSPSRKQIAAAIGVSLGDASQGMAMAFPSSALPQMMKTNTDLHVTGVEASIIAATVIAFASIGNLLSGFFMDRLGRKRTMLLCSFPIVLGYIMVAIASDFAWVIGGRALIGLFTGISILTGTVYISEVTETSIRGSLLVLLFLSATVGHLTEFILGAIVQNWRLMTWISLPIPILFSFTMLILPESPRYLLAKENEEEAILSLTWFRSNKSNVENELNEIKNHMASDKKVLKVIPSFEPHIVKVLSYCLVLAVLHGSSGARLLIIFAEPISIKMRTFISPKILPIGLGLCEVLGQTVSMLTIDKIGRRSLLWMSGAGMWLMWFSLMIFTMILPPNLTGASLLDIIPDILLMIVTFSFNIGYRSVFYGLVAELLPLEIRGKGTGLAIFVVAFFVTCFSLEFLSMVSQIYLSGTFLVFSCVSFFAFLFPILFVPETKGKTLEEIEKIIQKQEIFMGITRK